MKKPTKRQKISKIPATGILFAPAVGEAESLQGLKRNKINENNNIIERRFKI